MIKWILTKIVGTKNQREVRRLRPIVEQIVSIEESWNGKGQEFLLEKTREWQGYLHRFLPMDLPPVRIVEAAPREELEEIAAKLNARFESLKSEFASLPAVEATPASIEEGKAAWNNITPQFDKLRERYLNQILPEAFAAVKHGARLLCGEERDICGQKQVWDMVHFDVQLLGGIALHRGDIAEMQTGEGKTLVATMPVYLNALTGEGVHVVTVNDYLAKRDSEWMGKVYRFLGLTVGLVIHDVQPQDRRKAYLADVTYGTNNEFGFDYLRDNMVVYKASMVQRGHAYAIVDEVDSILIDEARTPLIISGAGDKSTDLYAKVDAVVRTLKRDVHFEIEEKKKAISLTDEGAQRVEAAFGITNINDAENAELNHHVSCALRANFLMKRDVDYVVKDDQVIIVDEFTGRLMIGRRYSEGLHQAIEAKEHVTIERESRTLATITFQNYFRMYHKLSGMTGTAKTEEDEFQNIYSLDVVQIPTNKPNIRKDLDDMVYKTKKAKFNAVVDAIAQVHANGQPVLVGTVTVETSEMLSAMLQRRGIQHEVLNAKNHAKEAEIVAQAGHWGAVTIATNMAGRGTDILLGGNPEFLARRAMRQDGYDEEIIEAATGHAEDVSDEILAAREKYQSLYKDFKRTTDEAHDRVLQTGGLHIIGTERHESRRIDRQLRGRCSRQGDPGASQFFISFEDDLMRNFGAAERMTKMMERLGVADGEALEHSFLNKSVESAQKRVEQRNYMWRKHVLDYDDVMNKQREIVYGYRNEVLSTENPREMIYDILEEVIATRAHEFLDPDAEGVTHPDELFAWMNASFPLGLTAEAAKLEERPIDDTIAFLIDKVKATYEDKASRERPEYLDHMERQIILGAIDKMWQEHLYNMDSLREGVRLRAQGQKDPLVEYKSEAYDLFITLMESIKSEAISNLFKSTTNLDAFEDFLASLPQFESSDENQEGGTSLPEIGFDGMPSDLLSALREQVSRAREQQSARQAEPEQAPAVISDATTIGEGYKPAVAEPKLVMPKRKVSVVLRKEEASHASAETPAPGDGEEIAVTLDSQDFAETMDNRDSADTRTF